MVQVVHRYDERGEFVQRIGYKDAGIYGHVFGKGYLFDAGTCCTVCREGALISRNSHDGHVLTSLLSGKTSLILSLAGELGLDIYTVGLSSKGCGVIGSSPHYRANLGK